MYELQIKKQGKEWDAYPDPLYTDLKTAQAKRAYCESYEIAHNMKKCDYRIVKLDRAGIAKHEAEWKRWIGMID